MAFLQLFNLYFNKYNNELKGTITIENNIIYVENKKIVFIQDINIHIKYENDTIILSCPKENIDYLLIFIITSILNEKYKSNINAIDIININILSDKRFQYLLIYGIIIYLIIMLYLTLSR